MTQDPVRHRYSNQMGRRISLPMVGLAFATAWVFRVGPSSASLAYSLIGKNWLTTHLSNPVGTSLLAFTAVSLPLRYSWERLPWVRTTAPILAILGAAYLNFLGEAKDAIRFGTPFDTVDAVLGTGFGAVAALIPVGWSQQIERQCREEMNRGETTSPPQPLEDPHGPVDAVPQPKV